MKDNVPSDELASIRHDLEAATEHYRAGRLSEAVAVLEPLVVEPASDGLPEPNQAKPLELIGQILHDLGRPQEAADALEKASLVSPVGNSARIALASCYAQLKRIDLARELYLQLALRRQLSPELMLHVAAGLEAIDAPHLAMQVCEWAIEMDESLPQAYYDMGTYSIRAGQPPYVAEALTRRALQLSPTNIHYRFGLVSLMTQLKRDDEALRALGELTPDKIAQVTCITCLTRVSDLLRRSDKTELSVLCKKRAEQILRQRELLSKPPKREAKP